MRSSYVTLLYFLSSKECEIPFYPDSRGYTKLRVHSDLWKVKTNFYQHIFIKKNYFIKTHLEITEPHVLKEYDQKRAELALLGSTSWDYWFILD